MRNRRWLLLIFVIILSAALVGCGGKEADDAEAGQADEPVTKAEKVETQKDEIEAVASQFNEPLPPLKEFILPGGSQSVAFLQQARAVCRRVERSLHALREQEELNPVTAQYINRLSDLLFILARHVAFQQDGKEVYWHSQYSRLNKS